MQVLSPFEARKIALLSQGLPAKSPKDSGLATTLSALTQLGYVQIDTISVVQRAHHHTLWSRNPHYQTSHLDQLVADKQAFEYWSHAAAYLPMSSYRYSLPRKYAIKSGDLSHWYPHNGPLMAKVLERIEREGPLMAKDFESHPFKRSGWGVKPTKQALETLYMQGDLMVSERRSFHKVYDLTERVLPADIDTSLPTDVEYARFLVSSYLKAHGFGTAAEMCYLLKGRKALVASVLAQMVEAGELETVQVNGTAYITTATSLALLERRLSRQRAQLLSPFDNLLIQRQRAKAIFNFDYQIECYVPAAKRKFGYFSLPVLWDGRLVARADCKADKKAGRLDVLHLALESSLRKTDAFLDAFEQALVEFARFNQCDHHQILRVSEN
ncbi:winged helix-turn-helix domain-containing protein [Aliagarivorans marinus]|uniref:winged helix-turn-helix domain-containing protein n=1 Tax=Aliagarivorans marinus TaxID=561965 RepID=UPI000413C888|nr:crosslink repair DNA glycosylase YcaQ family protein [Aliagarivorans marinus]